MITNFLRVAWRNLKRNRLFSVINIVGLAIGLAVCFLIYRYVGFELSYDTFQPNASRLYRVTIGYSRDEMPTTALGATNHPAVGPALKEDFQEVENFARLVPYSIFSKTNNVLAFEQPGGDRIAFDQDRLFLVDPSFLSMLNVSMKEGSVDSAFAHPHSILLSASTARKYFGEEAATGKTMQLNRETQLTVTGVFGDTPENSHLQYDALMPLSIQDQRLITGNWKWPDFYNYILLAPGADPHELESKFPAFLNKYMGDIMRDYDVKCRLFLQPVSSIHLQSHLQFEQRVNGSESTVYFLSILAVFILCVAWVNYINLSSAKFMERSKEVGLRKVVGATRVQLALQFFFDAFLVNLFAVILAALLVFLAWPSFERLIGLRIGIPFLPQEAESVWTYAFAIFLSFLMGVAIVGLYPALLLSSYNPARALKGRFSWSESSVFLRKILVSLQYVISIFLIAATLVIYGQLRFMRNQELGFDKEQVLVVKIPEGGGQAGVAKRIDYFRNQLLQYPDIVKVSASTGVPGEIIKERNSIARAETQSKAGLGTYMLCVDQNYFDTYGLHLVAGRFFNESEKLVSLEKEETDQAVKVIINEENSKQLGFQKPADAVDQRLIFVRSGVEHTAEVIGVARNHFQQSVKMLPRPLLYVYPDFPLAANGVWFNWRYLSVKIKPGNTQQALQEVKDAYNSSFRTNSIDYFFLDDFINRQFDPDQQLGDLFLVFTILAIVVATLGLMGLSVFSVSRRKKEMAIHKILGASFTRLLFLESASFMGVLLTSYVIAVPFILLTSTIWLNNFPRHISPGFLVFAVPLLVLLLITLITTLGLSVRNTLANPAQALRNE